MNSTRRGDRPQATPRLQQQASSGSPVSTRLLPASQLGFGPFLLPPAGQLARRRVGGPAAGISLSALARPGSPAMSPAAGLAGSMAQSRVGVAEQRVRASARGSVTPGWRSQGHERSAGGTREVHRAAGVGHDLGSQLMAYRGGSPRRGAWHPDPLAQHPDHLRCDRGRCSLTAVTVAASFGSYAGASPMRAASDAMVLLRRRCGRRRPAGSRRGRRRHRQSRGR